MGIEIVDFPFKKVIFHSYVNVYQRGNPGYFWVHWLIRDIVGQFMLIHVLSMAAWHMPLLFQPELRPSLPKLWKCLLLELQSYQVGHRLRGNLHGMPWLFPRRTTSEEDTFCSKS